MTLASNTGALDHTMDFEVEDPKRPGEVTRLPRHPAFPDAANRDYRTQISDTEHRATGTSEGIKALSVKALLKEDLPVSDGRVLARPTCEYPRPA